MNCPKCEGKGYVIVKNPKYKVGSLSLYLKRKKCRFCDGRGEVPSLLCRLKGEAASP